MAAHTQNTAALLALQGYQLSIYSCQALFSGQPDILELLSTICRRHFWHATLRLCSAFGHFVGPYH